MRSIVELIQEKLKVSKNVYANIPKRKYVTVELLDFVAWVLGKDPDQVIHSLSNKRLFASLVSDGIVDLFFNKNGDSIFTPDGSNGVVDVDDVDDAETAAYDFFSEEIYTPVHVSIDDHNKQYGIIKYGIYFKDFTYFVEGNDEDTDFITYAKANNLVI